MWGEEVLLRLFITMLAMFPVRRSSSGICRTRGKGLAPDEAVWFAAMLGVEGRGDEERGRRKGEGRGGGKRVGEVIGRRKERMGGRGKDGEGKQDM